MRNSLRDKASEIVLKAGKYLKQNSKNIKSIAFKGSINLVTNVDREVEDILKRPQKEPPDDRFLIQTR